jgi:hypothetical protein
MLLALLYHDTDRKAQAGSSDIRNHRHRKKDTERRTFGVSNPQSAKTGRFHPIIAKLMMTTMTAAVETTMTAAVEAAMATAEAAAVEATTTATMAPAAPASAAAPAEATTPRIAAPIPARAAPRTVIPAVITTAEKELGELNRLLRLHHISKRALAWNGSRCRRAREKSCRQNRSAGGLENIPHTSLLHSQHQCRFH